MKSPSAPIDPQRFRQVQLVYWLIWGAILGGLLVLYLVFGRRPLPAEVAPEQAVIGLVAFAPLFVSVVIRWLVLPKFTSPLKALPLFVAGLALAEACGILGIFLGGPYRDDFALLGLLGVVQFLPYLLQKLFAPAGSGFRPDADAGPTV